MKSDFEQFQAQFTDYLENYGEPKDGLYFLRYETLEAASHLAPAEEYHLSPEQALKDHIETLEECQDYAVSNGVTSTYIFFDAEAYDFWLKDRELQDTAGNRAEWARQKVEVEIEPHVSNGIVWFTSLGVPAKKFVAVLE